MRSELSRSQLLPPPSLDLDLSLEAAGLGRLSEAEFDWAQER